MLAPLVLSGWLALITLASVYRFLFSTKNAADHFQLATLFLACLFSLLASQDT